MDAVLDPGGLASRPLASVWLSCRSGQPLQCGWGRDLLGVAQGAGVNAAETLKV